MDIKKTSINNAQDTQNIQNNKQNTNQDSSIKFSDELKELAKQEKQNPTNETKNNPQKEVQESQKNQKDSNQNIPFGNLNNKENELNKAIKGLNTIVKEFNQSEDKFTDSIKNNLENTDNNNMINNDYNIQDKEILPQMNPNMNFSGDGQPFSSFMNDNTNDKKKNTIIGTTAQDLAEEAQILSTMAENIAIANKNIQLESKVKTIMNEEGVEKVDIKTGIKIETVVKYDTIIMNQADVEVFATLVENKEADLSNLAPKAAEKSVKVSQALADMLIKAKETNQPIRINFDNDISIIIKISRDGKLTADFLPSSQVAEAYLRENLPLLRQRFDEKNLEYDSLNQRERKDSNKENHKKKDRNNE